MHIILKACGHPDLVAALPTIDLYGPPPHDPRDHPCEACLHLAVQQYPDLPALTEVEDPDFDAQDRDDAEVVRYEVLAVWLAVAGDIDRSITLDRFLRQADGDRPEDAAHARLVALRDLVDPEIADWLEERRSEWWISKEGYTCADAIHELYLALEAVRS